jgi:tetratricopeptide (TPR) repeat protein
MNSFKPSDFENYESILIKLHDASSKKILTEQYSAALTDLKTSESLLDTECGRLNPFLHLSVLHNLSLCYQRAQKHQEAIDYIKLCIQIAKRVPQTKENPYSPVALAKYRIIRILQLCAALSFESKHELALIQAKKALKHVYKLFEVLSNLIAKHSKIPKRKKSEPRSENIEKALKKKIILDKVLQNNFERTDLLFNQDWIYSYNMGNIMTIQPFLYKDWIKPLTLNGVLSLAFIEKAVFLLIACHFTIATEVRLLGSSSKPDTSGRDWHSKALEIGKCFLPNSCAFFSHLLLSYSKHYKVTQKPEDRRSLVPKSRRIYEKRNSERPRNVSEKSCPKPINTNYCSKLTPTRKLTPSTRNVGSKIRITRVKRKNKDRSPAGHIFDSVNENSTSTKMLKIVEQPQTLHTEICESLSSESFDCNS